jgi:uncharacterized protein (TIGR00369 family)
VVSSGGCFDELGCMVTLTSRTAPHLSRAGPGAVAARYIGAMRMEAFLQVVPHAAPLGIEMLRWESGTGQCAMRLPWREELIGDPERRIVFGGVITTLLDTLGGACVFARGKGVMPQATLDLRIDYLRPAAPELDLVAEGECFRSTRHIAFVRGVCHQGDAERPVANMTATFMIADRPELIAGKKS